MSMCWGFDKNYFVPNNKGNYTYDFDKYKIPLIPFDRSVKESVLIYEVISSVKPDIVITIGDIYDFGFMKSIKMFYSENIKWINITANYQTPIPQDAIEAFDSLDAAFCTSQSTFNEVSNYYHGPNKWNFSGCDDFKESNTEKSNFRIMANAKNCQSDNLPVLIEACQFLKQSKIPELELYLHTNCFEKGEYDMDYLKQKFDPKNEFLKYPERYVSLFDGISNSELSDELSKSHLFVSTSLVSSTGMTIFEAMACGAIPLAVDNEINRYIFKNFEEPSKFLIDSVKLMTVGHSYLSVISKNSLIDKITYFYENYKNIPEVKRKLKQFVQINSKRTFLDDFRILLEEIKSKKEVIFLESIGDPDVCH